MIIDQTFGQSISIDVRDKDMFDKDDSLGMYVLHVCSNEKFAVVYHTKNQRIIIIPVFNI